MATVDLMPVSRALSQAFTVLHDNIEANAEARNLNASGRTIGSILTRTMVIGDVAVVGDLSAEEQWKFVGNGRGPGRMPPVDNIQAWIDSRGLDLSAWAVARKIAKEGTGAFRRKEANVFTQSIDAWEVEGLSGVEEAAAKVFENASADIIVNGLQSNNA